ncbi:hypothetical protein ASZ78_013314, partial [Callipepla squamata]
IIEVGLCEVFELIKETRFSHPSLCLRSLQALLNVLQGQQPEGLQSEPPEVLESLFQLLLEITVRSTGMNDSTGQSLTALSCACLFSLVPTILNSLQRSVQAVLVGKIQIQDWFSNGIKKAALMHKWPLKEISVDEDDQCLLQSDGFFLYLLCKDGLYKIGSGYSGTVRGHIYNSTSRIKNRKEKKSWLGYAQGYLLYRDANNHSMTAIRINPETLEQDGTVALPDCHTEGQNILFTDGEYINQIAASRDDGFVVRIFATSTEPVLQQELQLKLARKCLHACGISLFDLEKDLHIISTGFDEESAVLGAGREFALMKTASGKIYYTGKYQSLGIKQGGPSAGKWVELPITKSPKIIQFSVGHDGSHALLVADDGSIFFTGSASKGEDGESTKSRRQSKPYKPKKIIKMEGKIVISTACNNGSSSVISKDGELYMFGKDAIYSDSTSLVTDLKGHFVTQVAMGKAHTCVLMKNGEVWTFGVNNKGQCGRDTGSMSQGGKATIELRDQLFLVSTSSLGFGVENMATAMDEDLEEELDEKDEKSMMCPPGMHKWKLEQCMVCTVCGDCTGYGASCVSSGRPDRVPGGICGCGSGESGCAVCGCCKACARELDGQEARQRGILDAVKEMIPLDLLLAVPVPGVNIEEHLQLRQEEKRQRVIRRHRLEEGRGPIVFPGPIFMNHREQALARIRPHPAQLKHKRDKHKVILMENGDVYTFGYGQHGQLGHGDVNSRFRPNARELWSYNAVVADSRLPSAPDMQSRCSILSPELALPTGSKALTTRSHAALHILGCLDTLAAMQDLKMGIANTEEETQAVMKVYSKEDYSVVNRFESHGGGWGYSAHSVEAIRFCADTDILLGGLGLFGGRGEYTAKIKLFELGPDGGDHETDGDLLAETDVLAYDCAAREKYAMMFDEPVLLQAGWWYVAWARVSGPSSDCGSHGQASITTDDGVVFQFKSSKKSNNGTDVNAGQIPQLLYRLPTSDGSASKGKQQTSEPVHILKRSFARTVSVVSIIKNPLCFLHILSYLTKLKGVHMEDIQEANFKTSSSRLLAAVMSALCHTSVKLTSIFPIAYDGEALLRSVVKQVSTENDSALAHRFPLLVSHMEKLSQSEENVSGMTSFREVLEKMLVIVVLPVRNSLRRENELFSSHLVSNTCGLLASIVSELTASALGSEADGLNSLHSVKSTPNRFTKTSQGRSWNTGNGSPDAICFSVDKAGVVVVGFSVYGGGGIHEYELEVLVDDSDHTGDSTHSHRWTSLELVKGTYTTDDSPSDIAEIRLDKVVPLKENVKYAVRLRNYGSRTANGDGGMTTVQCPDGVTFTFSTCSLSSNGTNQTRGQIPQILYYRSEYDGDLQSQLLNKANEEDKNCSRALSVVSAVVRAAKDLLHRALAVDAEDIPELLSSSSLFSMLLPLIIAYIGPVAAAIPKVAVEVFGLVQQLLPSVAVLNQKYAPPAFNPNQSTDSTTGNQPEQGLSACTTSNHYAVVESEHPYKPACVTHYKGYAKQALTVSFKICILKGNEALFSLETASDYVKDEKACFYGFKCYAIGYEFSPGSDEGIIQLEKELANLGGSCAAALMKKDLALPIAGNEFEEDLEILEEAALQVEVKAIPVSQKKTSLQQEQVKKVQRIPGSPSAAASPSTDMTFGGLPSPKLDSSYEPMIVKEARYIAITMMKAYENYSFEELRFASPTPKRPSENMLIRVNNDGTYCANWTPGAVGLYTIHVTIDGIEIDAGLEVKVKDPPKGMIPPGTQLIKPKAEPQPNKVRKFVAKDSAGLRIRSHPSLQSEQIGIVKVNGSITFIDEIHNDDGVWLRLNDETIKKYVPNMNGYTEAWCLSFNQHLGKSLLVPVDVSKSQGVRDLDFFSWTSKALPPKESRSSTGDFFKDLNSHCPQEAVIQEQDISLLRGGPGVYKVVKTGPSGHNIRSCPNLRGIPIGMLVLGNKVKAVGEVTNSEGTWVQMDKNSMVEFCESDEGEAWSLARDRGGNQYLRHEDGKLFCSVSN